jgi:iron complex outermembrane receptor protein
MNTIWYKAILIASLYVLHTPDCFAQSNCEATVYILVSEARTQEAVPGALIQIARQQSVTDLNGYALLHPVCPGQTKVRVEAMGYKTLNETAQVAGGDTLHLRLEADKVTLDEVEIKGHRQAVNTSAAAQTLSKEALEQAAGGSLANVIQSIPGVRMMQTGATIAKPVIDGMHSNRILVLNNGIRQEGQQWGAEHAPEIDPFMAKHITVIKGAEAIQYGAEAIGGVVIADPPQLPADSTIHGELNLVGASNGRSGTAAATLEGNLKKIPALAWRVQGTLKRSGNIQTADYFLDNTGTRERNYNAALGYTKKHFDATLFYSHFERELGIFRGSEVGNADNLEAIIANGRPFSDGTFSYDISAPKQSVIHNLAKAKIHLHLNDYLHLTATYGFQRDQRREYDLRRGGRTSVPSLDLDLKSQTLDLSLDYYNGKKWKATAGLSGMYMNNGSMPGTFTTPLIPDYIAQGAGAYLIGKYIERKYELDAGLRYDYEYLSALGYNKAGNLYGNRHNYHAISASLGGIWHINNAWDLRSNIGTAWRPPTVNELYSAGLHVGAGDLEYGDSSITTEKSAKWITSLEFNNLANWLHLSMNAYAQYFSGYIYFMPTGIIDTTIQGKYPVFQASQTDARFLGMDLHAQVTFLKQFSYELTGSLIRAKDIQNNTFLPMIPTDQIEQSFRWNYNPVSFLKNSYIQLSDVFVAQQTRYTEGSDFAPPPPAYNLVHLGLGTSVKMKNQSLDLNFSVNNLTNALYKDYMNRFRYYAHDLGRNYTLRLAWHF